MARKSWIDQWLKLEVFTGPKIRTRTRRDPQMCCAEPTRTRILFESGTRTRVDPRNALNVLPGPDADPTIIRKWTRTRLGRHRPDCTRPDRHILHSKCYEVNKRCEEKKRFALTTVSSSLPDCDAYNPPCQYISIHVRLFLSLAVWNSLLNPLIIPASKVLAVTETDD